MAKTDKSYGKGRKSNASLKASIPVISVVIPVYNEEESVHLLHEKVCASLKSMKTPFEVIFIDDGSTDGTFSRLCTLSPIRIIRFRKNFGQTSAMAAGFEAARGDIIVSMDGDLQNDPADIPLLVEKLNEGYDVVCGWRSKRQDTFGKRLFSKIANVLRRGLLQGSIHDSGCSLRAYKKVCFEDCDLMGEMHRYIPALLRWKGFRITEVPVRHYPRRAGISKYGPMRIINGFLDLITVWFWRKFSTRPLHIFGGVGLFLSFCGSLLGGSLLIARQVYGYSLGNSQLPLLAVLLFVVGIQLFISGLMADISVKTYYNSKGKKAYSIEQVIDR